MASNVDTDLQIVVDVKDDTSRALKGIESSVIRFVGAVSASLAALSVAIFPLKAATDFQKRLLDVAKTTGYTEDQVSELAEAMQRLSTTTNVSAASLADIAAAGGQLGLGAGSVKDLAAFVDTTSRFASVLNVSVDDAAAGIGKISNIFGIMTGDLERISSTLNQVSNTSTITGAELLDIIQRIGTAGGTLNLQKAAALAAFGKDLGLTSETVGTTLNKIFLDLQAKAADVARLIGIPVQEFADLVKTDGIAAYKLYVEALSRLDNVQRSVISEQITGGGRIAAFVTSSINDAKNGFALLNKEVFNANKGWDSGTSSIDEQKRVLTGLGAQLEILKNVFVNIATVVGTKALPYMTSLVKRFQEFGNDPVVTERLQSFVDGIGEAIVKAVDFISKLSALSEAIVPLATALKLFIGIQIISYLGRMASGFLAVASSAYKTIAAWGALARADQQTARSIAQRAADAQTAAATRGKAAPNLSNLAKLATAIDQVYSPIRANQIALREAYERTENRINALTARRAQIVGDLANKAQALAQTQRAEARRIYDDVLRSGGTIAQAQAQRTAFNRQTRAEIARLSALAISTDAKYAQALARRSVQLNGIAGQELANQRQMSTVSAPLTAFNLISAGAKKTAASVAAIGIRIISIASAFAGVIGLVIFFLNLFGVFDTVVGKLKSVLGIEDEAEVKRRALEKERLAALEVEKKRVSEVGEAYRALLAARKDAPAKSGASVLADDIRAQVEEINKARDSYADLVFKGAALSSNVDFVASRWSLVNQELEIAKKKLLDLLRQKQVASPDTIFGGNEPVTRFDKSIKEASADVDRLANTVRGLSSAQNLYSDRIKQNFEQQKAAAENALAVASGLAKYYDEAGISALQALEKVLLGENALADAKKKEEDAKSRADAGDKEKQAYELAQEAVHRLTAELALLQAEYESVLNSSTAATVFITKALPGEAQKSLDAVRTVIGAFSGISGVVGTQISDAANKNAAAIKDLDTKLAELERRRQTLLVFQPNSSGRIRPQEESERAERAKKINAEFDAARVPLLRMRRDLEAVYQQEVLVQKTASLVKGEYDKLSDTQKNRLKDYSQVVVASIASVSANKILTDALIKGQERVAEGAKFNATRVKSLYDSSLTHLASVVGKMKDMLLGLGNYFASRKIAVKLANAEIGNQRDNDLFAKFQEQVLNAERDRLAASGLNTAEQDAQLRIMQEMLDLEAKRRTQAQDAERQQTILNDAQQRMVQYQREANEYTQSGIALAKASEAARVAGDVDKQISLGRQAEEEAQKARIAIEDMGQAYQDFKEEARKPVIGPAGAYLKIADEQIRDITAAYAKTEVAIAQGQANILKLSTVSAEAEMTKQSAALSGLRDQLKSYDTELNTLLSSKTGEKLKGITEALGQIAIDNTQGTKSLFADLKSIADSDFSGLTKFDTLATNASTIKAVRDAIAEVSTVYAQAIVPAGADAATTSNAVLENVKAVQAVQKDLLRTKRELERNPDTPVALDFTASIDRLEEMLRNRKFLVNLEPNVSGSGLARNASGGYIRGPGSGTSDSILSWLSNGEYVSDARTTSFFGTNFFRSLKSIARGGTASALRMLSGFNLPAFAGGGPVLPGMVGAGVALATLASDGNVPIIGRVAVDLNVAGDRVSLLGERQQVEKLVRALHRVNRG